MTATATKQFEISIVYNGVTKPITVNPEQTVQAVREHAIRAFGITQNPHLLGLFTDQGAELSDTSSVESAGITPGETLLLRPSAVRAAA